MTPQEKAYSIQEVINLIDDRQYDNDPRAEEAKKTLETIRQALQSQDEKDRVMKLMAEALRQFGYAYPYNPPCHDWRPKALAHNLSGKALSEYTKLGGTQDE